MMINGTRSSLPSGHVTRTELSQIIHIYCQSGQMHLEHLSDTVVISELTSVGILGMRIICIFNRLYGTV